MCNRENNTACIELKKYLHFGGFLKDTVAVWALHHETPAQALTSSSRVVEVSKRVGHGRDTFTWCYLPDARPLLLTHQPGGQPVQRRVQGARHVGVGWLGAAQRGGRVGGQLADEWGEEVAVAGLCRFDQTVHVDVELFLLEGAGEDSVAKVLHPGQQREVQVIAAVTAQHVDAQEDLALGDLLACRLALQIHRCLIANCHVACCTTVTESGFKPGRTPHSTHRGLPWGAAGRVDPCWLWIRLHSTSCQRGWTLPPSSRPLQNTAPWPCSGSSPEERENRLPEDVLNSIQQRSIFFLKKA